jgi:hypothetical protein
MAAGHRYWPEFSRRPLAGDARSRHCWREQPSQQAMFHVEVTLRVVCRLNRKLTHRIEKVLGSRPFSPPILSSQHHLSRLRCRRSPLSLSHHPPHLSQSPPPALPATVPNTLPIPSTLAPPRSRRSPICPTSAPIIARSFLKNAAHKKLLEYKRLVRRPSPAVGCPRTAIQLLAPLRTRPWARAIFGSGCSFPEPDFTGCQGHITKVWNLLVR